MGAKPRIDTSRPHPARVYDYLLGGKDHYEVDRQLGEKIPEFMRNAAHENRAFMRRAVTWTANNGVTQFLDIGTGIPTAPNLHQVAQGVHPAARVVYADNDPIIMRHAEALLVGTPEGATNYVEADIREPGAILDHAREYLDFERPITLSLIAIMHFIVDAYDPYGVVSALMDALPSGSYLALTHVSLDGFAEEGAKLNETYTSSIEAQSRSVAEIERFFDGLELIEPGVVATPRWRTDTPVPPETGPHPNYAGVARKR
ncbi:SAM-dependent methyltransferase [Streptomyces montanisoli]|uniref:SAM-dependent methyltransferase n=1 Tax=Streptomyces montanisoli TaxID=2798581 RepID=A0A940S0B0_9ACTN|nr:SAM-dependent methyltransferase [Streptomyces montanisoli]MBP0460674.1 SAM-dependent methyltransferase [Streptomyces montanisoli]